MVDLKYIMEQEKNRRFVIQAQFPGPMYRDSCCTKSVHSQRWL